MKESSPSFQFYPRDFLADANVMAMNLTELGAYIKLLCICWREGSIPSDHERIGRLLGVPSSAVAELWHCLGKCFEKRGDTLVQPRLERERDKQNDYRQAKVEAGRRGGKSKARRASGQIAEPHSATHSATPSAPSKPVAKPSSASASASVRTNTPPRTRTVPGPSAQPLQTAPSAGGGGGDPEPESQTQTRPREGVGGLDVALASLGIGALDDQVARHEIAAALATDGITAAELVVLDQCARRAGTAHDGSTGRGLLLSWLRSPERCREQLRGHEKRNPPAVNGADREGPPVLADGDARYAERRAKVDALTAALGELELDALDRPTRVRAVAESLVDSELTEADLVALDGHARALSTQSPDPDSDPDGRELLEHWLLDVRLAREVVAGLELGEPAPAKRDGFDLGPIFGEVRQ